MVLILSLRHSVCVSHLNARNMSSCDGRVDEDFFASGTIPMNLGELIEFAGIVSRHGATLVEAPDLTQPMALDRFRDAHDLLLDRWDGIHRSLVGSPGATAVEDRKLFWQRVRPIFADVFAVGLIARLWGALLTAAGRRQEVVFAERAARGALALHDRVQQKFLRLMVDGPGSAFDQILALDHLRRQIERWSDLFVGHIILRHWLVDFAVEPNRALEFGQEQCDIQGRDLELVWEMYFVCIRSTFFDIRLPGGETEQMRNELLRAIFATFPTTMLLGENRLKSTKLAALIDDEWAESPSIGSVDRWGGSGRSTMPRRRFDFPPLNG